MDKHSEAFYGLAKSDAADSTSWKTPNKKARVAHAKHVRSLRA